MQFNSDINDVGKTNGAYSNPPQQKKNNISLQKWPYWTDIEFCIFQLSPLFDYHQIFIRVHDYPY